jgi:RimJ/RimL family protein N-acetyltransferase
MGTLSARKLNNLDYDDILLGWWKDWEWEAPTKDFLPDNGEGGIIIFDGEVPICAGFAYLTNSKVAWVDWIISDKNYNEKATRKEAIRMLISSLTNVCKNVDFKYCYALIKNQSLIKVYEELGYVQGDNYTTEMIKAL